MNKMSGAFNKASDFFAKKRNILEIHLYLP